MKRENVTNTFSKGMVSDITPIQTPDKVYTSALNATLTTFDGEELAIQNDKGNVKIEGAKLPSGYIPIGSTELGGIIYIVSYNPISKNCQIGSFPSPEDGSTYSKNDTITIASPEHFYNSSTEWRNIEKGGYSKEDDIKHTEYIYTLMNDYTLSPGDKFYLYTNDLPISNLYDTSKKTAKNYLKLIPCVIDSNNRVIEMVNLIPYEVEDTKTKLLYNSYVNTQSEGKFQVFRSNYSGKLALKVQLISPTSFDVGIEDRLENKEITNGSITAYASDDKTQYNFIIKDKSVKFTKEDKITYKITPVMKYGAITELTKTITIDTDKINSGESELFAWNYKVSDDSLKLNYGIHTYLNDNQTPIGINLAFYTITEVNKPQTEPNLIQAPLSENVQTKSNYYAPIIRCSMYRNEEFHPTAIDVAISINEQEAVTNRYFIGKPEDIGNSENNQETIKKEDFTSKNIKCVNYFSTNQFTYNGNKTLNIQIKDDFEKYSYTNESPVLKKDRLYLTKIRIGYIEDNTINYKHHYRWLYTNKVFNDIDKEDFNESTINIEPTNNIDIQWYVTYPEKTNTHPDYMSLTKPDNTIKYSHVDMYNGKYKLYTTLPNNLQNTFSIPEYTQTKESDVIATGSPTISQIGDVSLKFDDIDPEVETSNKNFNENGEFSFNINYINKGIAQFKQQDVGSYGVFKPLAYDESTYNFQGFTLRDMNYWGYNSDFQDVNVPYKNCAVPLNFNAILFECNNTSTMTVYGIVDGEAKGDDDQSLITNENTDGSWEDDARLQNIYDRLGFNKKMYYGCVGYGVIGSEDGRTWLFTATDNNIKHPNLSRYERYGKVKSMDCIVPAGWKYPHKFIQPEYDSNGNESNMTWVTMSIPNNSYACMDMRVFLKRQGRDTYIPIFAEYFGNPRTTNSIKFSIKEIVGKPYEDSNITKGGQNAPFMWFWARLLNSVYIYTKDTTTIKLYKATGIKYIDTLNFNIKLQFKFTTKSSDNQTINGFTKKTIIDSFKSLFNFEDDEIKYNNLEVNYPSEYSYTYSFSNQVKEQGILNDYISGTSNNVYAIYDKTGNTIERVKTTFTDIVVNPEILYGKSTDNQIEYFKNTYSENGTVINTSDQDLIKKSFMIEDGTIKVRASVNTLSYYIGKPVGKYPQVDDRQSKILFRTWKSPRFLVWYGFPNATFGSPAQYIDGLEDKKVIQS